MIRATITYWVRVNNPLPFDRPLSMNFRSGHDILDHASRARRQRGYIRMTVRFGDICWVHVKNPLTNNNPRPITNP